MRAGRAFAQRPHACHALHGRAKHQIALTGIPEIYYAVLVLNFVEELTVMLDHTGIPNGKRSRFDIRRDSLSGQLSPRVGRSVHHPKAWAPFHPLVKRSVV